MYPFKKKVIIFLLFLLAPKSLLSKEEGLKILYFFSLTCPRCNEVKPFIEDLSKEFHVEGLLYGKKEIMESPFPVKRGTKDIASRYNIKGIPAIVVLKDGVFKQKIVGVRDIKESRIILMAFSRLDALSVSEAIENTTNKEIIITGWIIHKGRYFNKNSKFFITDRKKELQINPWLPLEAIKSPFKSRIRTMSDMIDKPVILKGRLINKESGLIFEVKEEIKE